MHELSLVDGIVRAVEERAQEKGGRVTGVKVGIGELAQFDLRVVRGLLKDLKKGTILQDARVTVEPEKARVVCLSCNSEWAFKDLAPSLSKDEKEAIHFIPELFSSYFQCPKCSKSYFEILEGRSVRLIEVTFDV